MSTEDISKIITESIRAPSGHNSQPWRFVLGDNTLKIFNVPERDKTIYNVEQRGSYLAHGALIENIYIVSSHYGYQADIALFPDKNNPALIASVSFLEKKSADHPLYPFIAKRTTNRKPYSHDAIADETLKTLKDVGREGINILFVTKKEEIQQLGKLFSINEKLLFQNRNIHQSFFPHIRWTQAEEEKKGGFFIKTLELPPPAEKIFGILKHWPIAYILGKIGFSKMVAKQNADLYASAGAIGAITAPNKDPETIVNVGRIMQNMWLISTKTGLSIHPLNGTFYLSQRAVNKIGDDIFSQKEKELLKRVHNEIESAFNNHPIVFIFRIGASEPPTTYSSRLSPAVTVN